MPDIEQTLREDRLLRDAAKAVLAADLALVKTDVNPAPAAAQLKANASQKAHDLSGDAAEFVSGNKGKIGGGLAVILLGVLGWIFRDQITTWLSTLRNND